MSIETRFHKLADGRQLACCEYGYPAGHPAFFAHGGPGSRLQGRIVHEGAGRHGFRLLATDRPGMGKSTFMPRRTLLDYAKDIASLADAFQIQHFGVASWQRPSLRSALLEGQGHLFPVEHQDRIIQAARAELDLV